MPKKKSEIEKMSPEERERFTIKLREWEERMKPMIDEARRSERITDEDLKIRINY